MSAIEDYVDSIPPEFLWCRDVGHSWAEGSLVTVEVFNERQRRWENRRRMRCDVCGSWRWQPLDDFFRLLGQPRIEYADGYCIKGGPGFKLTKDVRGEIRAVMVARHGGVRLNPARKGRPKKRR